jgi:predicted Zn-dependent protease
MIRRHSRIILAIFMVLCVAAAIGVGVGRIKSGARREQDSLVQAESFLKAGKPAEALALADTFAPRSKNPAWFQIQLQAATRLQLLPRLEILLDSAPEDVLKQEEASLLLARGFLQAKKAAKFKRVRTAWQGHERNLEAWRVLDADQLLLSGDNRKAEKLLRGSPSTAPKDADELVRLALVTAERNLAGAARLLDQAVALQPTNAVARWSRGEILERMGRMRLARVEYVSAVASAPTNSYWRDQLAEFYLRTHNHDLAFTTWAETPARPIPDFIQLKLQFFSRVLRPDPAATSPGTTIGELEPVVRYIAALKPGRFFDSEAFNRLPSVRVYAAQRPEIFWLRLLDALQNGNESAAFDLFVTESPRLQTWDPDLAGALERVLYFRRKQSLIPPGITFKSMWPETNRPPFFALLERAAREESTAPDHKPRLGPDFSALLRGSNIFSQLFLVAGWREAALQLRRSPVVEPGEPDAFSAAHAEALSLNRNSRAALEFLGTRSLPPASALVCAELLLESGRRDEARTLLRALAKLDSPAGVRASSLLAVEAMEKKDYAAARQCVVDQPMLAQADLGRELLARIALAENRNSDAEEIYRGILKTSIEAKTWFIRKAFSEGRWKEARQMVYESLDLMPDSPQLRETLAAIDEAEARSKARPSL